MSSRFEAPHASDSFLEPARAVKLAYGTYESRYMGAIALLLLGPVMIFVGYVVEANGGPPLALSLTAFGFLLFAGAWVLLPGRLDCRLLGGLVSLFALELLPIGLGIEGVPMPVLELLTALASAGAVAGWLVARERPLIAVRDALIAVGILQIILAIGVGMVAGDQSTDRVDYYFLSRLGGFLSGDPFGARHFSALCLLIVGAILFAVASTWWGRRRAIATPITAQPVPPSSAANGLALAGSGHQSEESTGLLALLLAIFVAPLGLFLGVRELLSARRAQITIPQLAIAAVLVGSMGTAALIGGGFGSVALAKVYNDGQRADAFCRRATADQTAAGDAAGLVPQIEAALAQDPATTDGAATRAAAEKQVSAVQGRIETITGYEGHGYLDGFMAGWNLYEALASYSDIFHAGTGPVASNAYKPPTGGPGAIPGLARTFQAAITARCG